MIVSASVAMYSITVLSKVLCWLILSVPATRHFIDTCQAGLELLCASVGNGESILLHPHPRRGYLFWVDFTNDRIYRAPGPEQPSSSQRTILVGSGITCSRMQHVVLLQYSSKCIGSRMSDDDR